MGVIIGAGLIGIGLLLLSISWQGSQGTLAPGYMGLRSSAALKDADSWHRAHRAAAVPLGVTAGCVALGGLAVAVSGWDAIGKAAAVASVTVFLIGFGISWRTANSAAAAD